VKGLSRAGLIVLIGSLATGCAAGTYDPNKLERRLESTGVAPTAAKCVVEKMTDKFGERRLGGRDQVSALELDAERALLRQCGVKTS
jgi:hypothetical protein